MIRGETKHIKEYLAPPLVSGVIIYQLICQIDSYPEDIDSFYESNLKQEFKEMKPEHIMFMPGILEEKAENLTESEEKSAKKLSIIARNIKRDFSN